MRSLVNGSATHTRREAHRNAAPAEQGDKATTESDGPYSEWAAGRREERVVIRQLNKTAPP